MKFLITIITVFVLTEGCNNISSNLSSLQECQESITITYQAVSRGFFEEISISSDSITISKDHNKKNINAFKNHKEDWNTCLELLSKVDMNDLSKLKAPTSYRYVDGAAHATLIIKNGDKEIRSSEFDHGHPPKEIKALVEKLQTFKKLSVKQ